MEIIFRHCCGLDVRKGAITACALTQAGGNVQKEVRTFRLSAVDLLLLHDWLSESGMTHVAMEGTALHWKPVFHLLEGSFTVLLIEMSLMKSAPGRKPEVEDCEWIADLLSYGLLKDSFVPPEPIGELRELLRYRKHFAEERKQEVNRLEKILESANLPRPTGLISEAGFSRKAALEVLLPKAAEELLTHLAKEGLREKLPLLREALQQSSWPAHQQFMLEQVIIHLDYLNEAFEQVNCEVQNRAASLLEDNESLKWETEVKTWAADKRLLVICANCKKIRDLRRRWNPIENLLHEKFAIQFSHTICPDCGKTLYPDILKGEEEESDLPQPKMTRNLKDNINR